MVSTQMVHVRVKKEIKDEASSALESMGLSISDAVRALLTRIAVEHQIPFELKVPNRATREAMEEADALTTPAFTQQQSYLKTLRMRIHPKSSECVPVRTKVTKSSLPRSVSW